jgi:hypothetical protein
MCLHVYEYMWVCVPITTVSIMYTLCILSEM